jgi:hypothetical protein
MANMKLFLTVAVLACILAVGTTTILTMQPNAGRSRPVPRLLVGAPNEGQSGRADRPADADCGWKAWQLELLNPPQGRRFRI